MIGKTLKGFLLVWLLSGCQPAEDKLVITGSSTISPLMADLAEQFETQSGIQVDVQSGVPVAASAMPARGWRISVWSAGRSRQMSRISPLT